MGGKNGGNDILQFVANEAICNYLWQQKYYGQNVCKLRQKVPNIYV